MKQSGKVQFLFWLFSLSVMLYLWIIWVAVQTFVLGDATRSEFPEDRVALLFILYGILVLSTLAGTTVAIFINNKRYINRFGVMVILIFITFLAGKGFFG
ncbi:hypothetical protein [Hydrogenimonas urashimensis]|uniref:hypothetical protein n=1 Tax=Hydrogenimonas urashimensis TaxID=2740515 RepID=UPI001F2FB3A0|nr:hypothetical protein [Hydrogenimonas urashimensis]